MMLVAKKILFLLVVLTEPILEQTPMINNGRGYLQLMGRKHVFQTKVKHFYGVLGAGFGHSLFSLDDKGLQTPHQKECQDLPGLQKVAIQTDENANEVILSKNYLQFETFPF